ncbi:MAG TPA: hypothetical protein VGC32_03330 [Solirubrobacterales bacterium]
MPRQRLRIEGSGLATALGRALVVAVALALVWYGAMLVLLAFKVDPATVDDLCGYRTAFDYLAGLGPDDISGTARALAAAIGLLVGIPCLLLAWRGLPQPRLTRHPVTLPDAATGVTEIQPRAIERAIEVAAAADPRVTGVRAIYEDGGILVLVRARQATELVGTLREVARLARASAVRHQLELDRIDVRLVNFNRKDRRELA